MTRRAQAAPSRELPSRLPRRQFRRRLQARDPRPHPRLSRRGRTRRSASSTRTPARVATTLPAPRRSARRNGATAWRGSSRPRRPTPIAALLEPYLRAIGPVRRERHACLLSRLAGDRAGAPARPGSHRALRGASRKSARSSSPRSDATRRLSIVGTDGYVALNAYLPPKERRGLVLIDPPFEARERTRPGRSRRSRGRSANGRREPTPRGGRSARRRRRAFSQQRRRARRAEHPAARTRRRAGPGRRARAAAAGARGPPRRQSAAHADRRGDACSCPGSPRCSRATDGASACANG